MDDPAKEVILRQQVVVAALDENPTADALNGTDGELEGLSPAGVEGAVLDDAAVFIGSAAKHAVRIGRPRHDVSLDAVTHV